MTISDSERITELRQQGFGYKRIADALSLPLNTVKSFCRRQNISQSLQVEQIVPEETENEMGDSGDTTEDLSVCKQCGAPLIQSPNHRQRQYCSDICRKKWWYGHQENSSAAKERICPGCGQNFMTVRGSKYCSHACYIKSRFHSINSHPALLNI